MTHSSPIRIIFKSGSKINKTKKCITTKTVNTAQKLNVKKVLLQSKCEIQKIVIILLKQPGSLKTILEIDMVDSTYNPEIRFLNGLLCQKRNEKSRTGGGACKCICVCRGVNQHVKHDTSS